MFERITENNKFCLDKPTGKDTIYYSELQGWQTPNAFRSFSLKNVIEERIYYRKNKKEYAVKANTYLTACKYNNVKAYNNKPIKSICIDLCPKTVAETFTVLTSKNEDLDANFNNIRSFHDSSVGQKLLQLNNEINSDALINPDKEWFLDLSERMIDQKYGSYLAPKGLKFSKLSTRKEVFQDFNRVKNISILIFYKSKKLRNSRPLPHVGISFLCRFKEAYKKTPYQYITI